MREFVLSMFVISSTLGYELPCLFKVKTNWTFDNVYHCELASDIESNASDVVTEVSGVHEEGFSFDNVEGFSSYRKILRYFPQELDIFIKGVNIYFIRIDNAELKEIHQTNLAAFYHLSVLSLHTNHIEVIEEDLFRFNRYLHSIILTNNRIKYIALSVFNALWNLEIVLIINNTCMSDYAFVTLQYERQDFHRLNREIEKKCSSKGIISKALTNKD